MKPRLSYPRTFFRNTLKNTARLLFALGAAGCIAVHPIKVPEDATSLTVEIGGYGRAEDTFYLEINDAAQVRNAAQKLNALSGRWRSDRSDALDADSAEIVFYRDGRQVYGLSAYHDTVWVGGQYYEVGEDLVSRNWWLPFR